jgi:hypothetical protein
MKTERNYETEKAAHEKTRLERNDAQKRAQSLIGTVRGLEAKVKRLEEQNLRQEKLIAGLESGERREFQQRCRLLDQLRQLVTEADDR